MAELLPFPPIARKVLVSILKSGGFIYCEGKVNAILEAQGCALTLNVDQFVSEYEKSLRTLYSGASKQRVRTIINQYFISTFFLLSYFFFLVFVPRALLQISSLSAVRQAVREAALRIVDVLGATVGLLCALPLFVVLPILIKIDSPGPVIYKQIRTGLDQGRRRQRRGEKPGHGHDRNNGTQRGQNSFGNPFYILKFRTMRRDAESNGPVWAQKNDPRITRVGKWLRKAHIDEVPQFLNVLKGEMSLVGPRPERPEIITSLVETYPEYQKRLSVKPGITGISQICLGYDSNLDDVRKKTKLDMLYISQRSVSMHMKVLFYTAGYILTAKPIDQKRFLASRRANGKLNYRISYEPMH